MIVNKRDLGIIDFGFHEKFITLKQVGMMFFPDTRNFFQAPMKKVRTLAGEGYLKTVKLSVTEKRFYLVTAKGSRLLKKHGYDLHGLKALKGVNKNAWEHDECVGDARVLFMSLLGFYSWTSERVLKKEYRRKKVPDAIATIGQERFAIEVELNLKKKSYYEHMFPEMCRESFLKVDAILYIMKNETDKKWLMKLATHWEQIYFTTAGELQNIRLGLTLTNGRGETIYIPRYDKGSVHFPQPDLVNRTDGYVNELEEWREDDRECERFLKEDALERKRKRKEQREKRKKEQGLTNPHCEQTP